MLNSGQYLLKQVNYVEKSTIDIDNLLGAEFWAVSSKTGKLCRKIVL